MPRLQKVVERILIALIIGFAILDVFIIIDLIVSDPVGHLTINFDW